MAAAAARAARAHESLERPRWAGVHSHRNRLGVRVGRSASRTILVLRSEVCDHAAGAASLRGVFPPGTDGVVARRARVQALHIQFFCGGDEFYGGEPVLVTKPPVLLGAQAWHGDRSRRTESPDGAGRGARTGVLHGRTIPKGGGRIARAWNPRRNPGPFDVQPQRNLWSASGKLPRVRARSVLISERIPCCSAGRARFVALSSLRSRSCPPPLPRGRGS